MPAQIALATIHFTLTPARSFTANEIHLPLMKARQDPQSFPAPRFLSQHFYRSASLVL